MSHIRTRPTCDSKIEEGQGCMCSECGLSKRVPHIPMYAPYSKRDLPKGTSFEWCTCGKSTKDPYCDRTCDGEEKDDRFRPIQCTLLKEQKFYSICGCKYTSSPPFCDGSHSTMKVHPKDSPCKCEKMNDISW